MGLFGDGNLVVIQSENQFLKLGLLKRTMSEHHFVENHSQRPDVRLKVIGTPVQNFRCHIKWRPYNSDRKVLGLL